MAKAICPHCNTSLEVEGSGEYVCSSCKKSFQFNTVTKTQDGSSVAIPKKKTSPVLIVILVLLGLCGLCGIIGALSPKSDINSNNTNTTKTGQTTQTSKPKEGDTLLGLSRAEIENNYNGQKKLSEVKAKAYADSTTNQDIVWVGKVTQVDTETFGAGYNVYLTMNGYTTIVKDPTNKYGDLVKGQLVKVSGKIDSLFEFVGVTVYVKDSTIEVLN